MTEYIVFYRVMFKTNVSRKEMKLETIREIIYKFTPKTENVLHNHINQLFMIKYRHRKSSKYFSSRC